METSMINALLRRRRGMILGGGGAASGYADVVLADSPIAYWPLEADAADVVGAHDGVANGTPTFDGAALANSHAGSVDLDPATADCFQVDAGAWQNGHTGRSLELWLSTDDIGTTRYIFWQESVLFILMNTGALHAAVYHSGGSNAIQRSVGLVVGTPVHVVVTWDGASIKMFVDGVQAGAAVPMTGTVVKSAVQLLTIGAQYNKTAPFAGQIAHAALYDHALTLERILAHYNAGIGA